MSEQIKVRVSAVERQRDVFMGTEVFVCRLEIPYNDAGVMSLLPGMLASGELTVSTPVEVESVETRLGRFTSRQLLAEVERRIRDA